MLRISNIVKMSALGAILITSAAVGAAAQSRKPKKSGEVLYQVVSKEVAMALKSNALNVDINNVEVGIGISRILTFDKFGKLLSYDIFDNSVNEDTNNINRYNAKSDIKWLKANNYIPKGIESDITINSDKTVEVRSYDADGYVTDIVFYNADGSIAIKYEYSDDGCGNRIETVYEADGK